MHEIEWRRTKTGKTKLEETEQNKEYCHRQTQNYILKYTSFGNIPATEQNLRQFS